MTGKNDVCVSVLAGVPEGGRGLVRDLRVRWALEEAGVPYSVRKLPWMKERPADYLAEHPFGQVPSYREGEVSMFETGAIVLHIAERSEALLPRDPHGRGRAISWVFAALNSVELDAWPYEMVDYFGPGDWIAGAKAAFEAQTRRRLDRVADYLGDKGWLEGTFTAGDLMMVSVLRRIPELLADYPTLAAYMARGEARPAFRRALAAQLADFDDQQAA
jgi:glutathione S-transferase